MLIRWGVSVAPASATAEPAVDQAPGDRQRWRKAEIAPPGDRLGDRVAVEPAHVLHLVARLRVTAGPARDEAEHQRARKRPRLGRHVAGVGDPHAGFLPDLARHRL